MPKPREKKERKDAKKFNAKATPRSGGLWFAGGDSKSGEFLIESKYTDKKSFSIPVKMWRKIYREAILDKRLPMLSIEFGGEEIELVVMDKNDIQLKEDK